MWMAIAAVDSHNLALRADGTIVAWGYNVYGQTNVPSTATNAVAIAAGGSHSIALRADGTVVALGWNRSGQTNVPRSALPMLAVAGGGAFSISIVGDLSRTVSGSLTAPACSGDGFRVCVPTRSGHVYRLERKNSLDDTSWETLPLASGNGLLKTVVDPSAGRSQGFYRVREW